MLNRPGKWVGPVGQAKAIQRRQHPPGRDLEDRAISVGAAVLGSPVKVPVGTLDEGRLGIGADPIEIRKSRESLCRRRNRPAQSRRAVRSLCTRQALLILSSWLRCYLDTSIILDRKSV